MKKYLLSSVAMFAPPDDGAGGTPEDERIPEPTIDDDETVTDPQGESDDAGDDQGDDDQGDDQGDDDEGGEEPPARPSRGDRAIGALRAENRRLAEENARNTRAIEELRRAPPQPQQPLETPSQRAERLALLSPEERTQVVVDEALQRHSVQQTQLTNQLLDQSDRAAFEARATTNPLFRKLANEVERELATLRSKGQNLDRASIATFLIGKRVVEQQGKGKPAARQRRQAQEARPTNGRGDVGPDRQNRRGSSDPVADMERRFGDVPI